MSGPVMASLAPSGRCACKPSLPGVRLYQVETTTHLPRHTSAQSDLAISLHLVLLLLLLAGEYTVRLACRPIDHLQHDSRCQLVVRLTSALGGLENMDRVPGARRFRSR